MSLDLCRLRFIYVDIEKLLEDALRFETDVVLNILCLAHFTCVD